MGLFQIGGFLLQILQPSCWLLRLPASLSADLFFTSPMRVFRMPISMPLFSELHNCSFFVIFSNAHNSYLLPIFHKKRFNKPVFRHFGNHCTDSFFKRIFCFSNGTDSVHKSCVFFQRFTGIEQFHMGVGAFCSFEENFIYLLLLSSIYRE